MGFLLGLGFAVLIISAIGLIFFILLQNDEGDGLGSAFGGASSSLAPRGISGLGKITYVLTAIFLGSVLLVGILSANRQTADSVLQRVAPESLTGEWILGSDEASTEPLEAASDDQASIEATATEETNNQ